MSTCFHDVEGSEFYNGAATSCYIFCGFPGNIYWKVMSFSVRCTLLYSLANGDAVYNTTQVCFVKR